MAKKIDINDTIGAILLAVVAIAVIIAGVKIFELVLSDNNNSHTSKEGEDFLTTESATEYANDVLTAFNLKNAKMYSESQDAEHTNFQMAGEKYRNGIVFYFDAPGCISYPASVTYNVKGDYSTMSFYVGHQDNTNMGSMDLEVYLDNELYESYHVSADDIPKLIQIELKEKQTIRFETGQIQSGTGYCLADIMVE